MKRWKWDIKTGPANANHSYENDFTNKKPRGGVSLRWSDLIKGVTKLRLLTEEMVAKDRKK